MTKCFKTVISLILALVLLGGVIPVMAAGSAEVLSYSFYFEENGYEYEIQSPAAGTVKGTAALQNSTGADFDAYLFICTKDNRTNKLTGINVENVTIPKSGIRINASADITVSDADHENVFLYVWDRANAPLGERGELLAPEPEMPKIDVRATVLNSFRTYSRLSENGNIVRLKLNEVLNEEDMEQYGEYLTDTDTGELLTIDVDEGDVYTGNYMNCDVFASLVFNENRTFTLKEIAYLGEALEIAGEDIDYLSVSADGVEFSYWQENDVEATALDISPGAEIFNNGAYLGALGSYAANEAFNYATYADSVTLVKDAASSSFSRIYITQFIYTQVESVIAENETLYFEGGCVSLSKAERYNNNFIYSVYKDGKRISLSELAEGDVLSIVAPDGDLDMGDYLDIFVSDKTVSGTVTGASTLSDNIYYIDGVEYKTVTSNGFSVGDKGVFYLTHSGLIFSMLAEENYSYGFILNVGKTVNFGEVTVQLKLLTEDGSKQIYSLADGVAVTEFNTWRRENNTVIYRDSDQEDLYDRIANILQDAQTEYEAQENAAQRLIKYELSDGKIAKISFAADGVLQSDLKKAYDYTQFAESEFIRAQSRLGSYTYTDETIMFYAPVEDFGNYFTIDSGRVKLTNTDALSEGQCYSGCLYDISASGEFAETVITSQMAFAGRNNALAVVSDISTGINSEGEPADQITIIQSGQKATYIIDDDIDDFDVTNLDAGDIIQFVLNGSSEISQAVLIFDTDSNDFGSLSDYAQSLNDENIKYIFGILAKTGNVAFEITDDFTAYKENGTSELYALNVSPASTLANVNLNRLGTNSAVTALSSISSFRATKEAYTDASDKYLIVARTNCGDIVDAVSYLLPSGVAGADLDGYGGFVIS